MRREVRHLQRRHQLPERHVRLSGGKSAVWRDLLYGAVRVPASSIACDTSGGAPVCACTYRTADVCAPGCASSSTFTTACTAFASDFLAAWCPDAGCTPPPG